MSETTLKVNRLYYPELGIFKYIIIVSSSLSIDEHDENSIPSDYIASYVCNNMREFVNHVKLSEDLETIIVKIKETGEITCPRCGQSVFGKEKL